MYHVLEKIKLQGQKVNRRSPGAGGHQGHGCLRGPLRHLGTDGSALCALVRIWKIIHQKSPVNFNLCKLHFTNKKVLIKVGDCSWNKLEILLIICFGALMKSGGISAEDVGSDYGSSRSWLLPVSGATVKIKLDNVFWNRFISYILLIDLFNKYLLNIWAYYVSRSVPASGTRRWASWSALSWGGRV